MVAARRSVYNAADVVGEAELRQKVNRQENEHVCEEIGVAQNAESLAALCMSVGSCMDATAHRPNCHYLVSSNDVGVVYFVAVTIVARCMQQVRIMQVPLSAVLSLLMPKS